MSWINNVVPPKIRSFLKKETPENLWVKCPDSGQLVFHKDLENNLFVVPGSDFHMRMEAKARLATTFDGGIWDDITVADSLNRPAALPRREALCRQAEGSPNQDGDDGRREARAGKLDGRDVTIAVQAFDFIGGSLGMAAGEAIVTGAEHALKYRTPYILFAASGGARMQEGVFS